MEMPSPPTHCKGRIWVKTGWHFDDARKRHYKVGCVRNANHWHPSKPGQSEA